MPEVASRWHPFHQTWERKSATYCAPQCETLDYDHRHRPRRKRARCVPLYALFYESDMRFPKLARPCFGHAIEYTRESFFNNTKIFSYYRNTHWTYLRYRFLIPTPESFEMTFQSLLINSIMFIQSLMYI